MQLGSYLKENGMTYAAFGERVDVSHVTVHRWVMGHTRPTYAHLRRIEAATGGTVGYADFAPPPQAAA